MLESNYIKTLNKKNDILELEKVSFNSDESDLVLFLKNDKVIYASTNKSQGSKTFEWTGEGFLDLYEVEVDENKDFGKPQKLRGDVNTKFHESNAVLQRWKNNVFHTK